MQTGGVTSAGSSCAVGRLDRSDYYPRTRGRSGVTTASDVSSVTGRRHMSSVVTPVPASRVGHSSAARNASQNRADDRPVLVFCFETGLFSVYVIFLHLIGFV